MISCKLCEGRKTFLGMGGMREKCKKCDGKGFMPETNKQEEQLVPFSSDSGTIIMLDEKHDEDIFKKNLMKIKKKKEKKDVGKDA